MRSRSWRTQPCFVHPWGKCGPSDPEALRLPTAFYVSTIIVWKDGSDCLPVRAGNLARDSIVF